MRTYRTLRKYLLPYWLLDDEADGAFAYTLSALIDVSVEHVRAGLEARFPSRAGRSALERTGRDRLIRPGRDETDAHYAARLRAWRYPRGHRVRGSVFALLEQVSEYFGGLDAYGIDRAGNRRARTAAGVESYVHGVAWTWDTGAASAWARQWLVIDAGATFAAHDTLTGTVGIAGSTAADWRAVVALTRGQHRWLPAGVQGEWIIVTLDGVDPTPDATWVKWGKLDGTDYVPSRSSTCRYVALRDALREYAGDTDWANDTITSLGTFTGDDTDYPATVSLPDGRSYAGIAAFRATITMPDDGSYPA